MAKMSAEDFLAYKNALQNLKEAINPATLVGVLSFLDKDQDYDVDDLIAGIDIILAPGTQEENDIAACKYFLRNLLPESSYFLQNIPGASISDDAQRIKEIKDSLLNAFVRILSILPSYDVSNETYNYVRTNDCKLFHIFREVSRSRDSADCCPFNDLLIAQAAIDTLNDRPASRINSLLNTETRKPFLLSSNMFSDKTKKIIDQFASFREKPLDEQIVLQLKEFIIELNAKKGWFASKDNTKIDEKIQQYHALINNIQENGQEYRAMSPKDICCDFRNKLETWQENHGWGPMFDEKMQQNLEIIIRAAEEKKIATPG